ncbi:hypothetical protein [Glutamicibacter ardleyensis]|uniref:PASTA domain-containing protein n=1 Tax=Glutamicibacter ardleyensis TaxID=225894 RepID=A0ABQ2DRP5_9MICC|nr:hypothetical protein [Glutamicibacter ardleyensis]GGJ69299.1 hypothetical protein GCM10007173_29990 [Glutamicibacter ardleyensis]
MSSDERNRVQKGDSTGGQYPQDLVDAASQRIAEASEVVSKAYPRAANYRVSGTNDGTEITHEVTDRKSVNITEKGVCTPDENQKALDDAAEILFPGGQIASDDFASGYNGNRGGQLTSFAPGEVLNPQMPMETREGQPIKSTDWFISIKIDPPMPPAPPTRKS